MWNGLSWRVRDRFPRVTLCDFAIRTMGNVQHYTVQCSLPLNLFNEKIYIFIYFWFIFVMCATILSFLTWLYGLAYLPRSTSYIASRLVAMDSKHEYDSKEVDYFVRRYLRRDGLLLIRLVSKNASDVIAAQLLKLLWLHYERHLKELSRLRIQKNDKLRPKTRKRKISHVSDVSSNQDDQMLRAVLSKQDATDLDTVMEEEDKGDSGKSRRRHSDSSYKSASDSEENE